MNILFLTLSKIEDINQRGLYIDLVNEISARGINIYVVTPREKRYDLPTECIKYGNITLLKVKTGNITKTKSLLEKGLSTLSIEYLFLRAIKKYLKGLKFDLVMYSTPPITFNRIVKILKKKDNSKTYLLLKDIFPQNAVDMGVMKHGSIPWRYFRNKEIKLYSNSDIIGCMSQRNLEYILNHNKYLIENKIEIFPNAIKPIKRILYKQKNKQILKKHNISEDLTLFIYGGNLGKPQGVNFILETIDHFHKIQNGHMLIIGSGTEFDKIQTHIKNHQPANVSILEKLSKEEYDDLILSADVGLVFLDNRFSIPNFPSRLTSYMENSLPILAATDKITDLKDVLIESNSGFWCESGDITSFIQHAKMLSENSELRDKMGLNGRMYLEDNYDITKTINILLKHLDGDDENV